ncbi:hypothetical protein DEVEQU_02855 [Devosia equisanguinis]|uniref:Uncharacterized protein n=1 Tax=Devosia equisanguinis TaxID=2490941 RepID=A0A3S4D6S1_9HYPH|nr:hypothetical protein [Devosia equisanguinis]VDS05712.1 hypothetical protein DEVEQU_02855 [Devosia equisanguinis]
MICCATLLLTLKLAWTTLRPAPRAAVAGGHRCAGQHVAPAMGRLAWLEIGTATVLLAVFSSAILEMALGQPPGALLGNIHQIGCLALGRAAGS